MKNRFVCFVVLVIRCAFDSGGGDGRAIPALAGDREESPNCELAAYRRRPESTVLANGEAE